MDALRRDLIETIRSLSRQPGFNAVVALTAALGIGLPIFCWSGPLGASGTGDSLGARCQSLARRPQCADGEQRAFAGRRPPGVGMAFIGINALLSLIPVLLPFWMKIEVDRTVLLFSLILTVLTGVLFGLAPALQASRVDLNRALKEGTRGSSGKRRLTFHAGGRGGCPSLLLLIGAGLMTQTFLKLQR
jgi:hypothetical protein